MPDISSSILYEAVKNLCLNANIDLPADEYFALKKLYLDENEPVCKNTLLQILRNAKIASETQRPLCQDTGFVTIFLEIGHNVRFPDGNPNDVIQKAVGDSYQKFFLRKSIVENPATTRENNNLNIPALIHTEFVEGDELKITLSVKGGGCENISAIKMLTPSESLSGIKKFVIETIKNAGSKPCPPIRIGLGIGSNFEGAAILSKKALLLPINQTDMPDFAEELIEELNKLNIGVMGLGGKSTCFGVNILERPCHIASLPVAISVSCHSSRHACALISEGKINYQDENYDFCINETDAVEFPEIFTTEIAKIKALKPKEQIFLSGKIYTARDAAHKKFAQLLQEGSFLPFDINNSIIFYAGPCPANEDEIIGPIGPTTSARMDIFTPELYSLGVLATIGKGERSLETIDAIKTTGAKYFTVTGGIASLLKNCIKSAKLIAYPELGTEAVYELEVEKLPLIVKY